MEKNLNPRETSIFEDRKRWNDLLQKFDQAKQDLIAPPFAPSTLTTPPSVISPTRIMYHIVEVVTGISSALATNVAHNIFVITTSVGVGLADPYKDDIGCNGTSSTEPIDMTIGLATNP